MYLGKRIEDLQVSTFKSKTLVHIEEVEILRYRISFNSVPLGIFHECTLPTLNISKFENATLLMKLSEII